MEKNGKQKNKKKTKMGHPESSKRKFKNKILLYFFKIALA